MKTITFYSYKGGVGRSLALSNIAIRLSELNKKVCVLDFDLEAPGLHFKFENYSRSKKIDKGIVDYIDEFSTKKIIPKSIKEYAVELTPANKIFEPIQLIPAGNIDDSVYWKKLSCINWATMFYEEESKGVEFFLDLKHKIETELQPDFLLIDSRTGITDIAGITLKLLADEAVILAANNEENMYGSKKIIKSLIDKENLLFGKTPKISFVLTRLPFTDEPKDKNKEFSIVKRRTQEIKNELSIVDFEIMVIHSDRRLEEREKSLIGDDYESKTVSISNDYLKLFDRLTNDVLTLEEVEIFRNKKNAEKEFNNGKSEIDMSKKLIHFTKAIELDCTKDKYFLYRSYTYGLIDDYENSEIDAKQALLLNSNSNEALKQLAFIYQKSNQFEKALNLTEKAIQIDSTDWMSHYLRAIALQAINKNEEALEIFEVLINDLVPEESLHLVLNDQAHAFRISNKYDEAYKTIFHAIEINPEYGTCFATLAEIYAEDNKENEFYLNLNIALSKGVNANMLKSAKDVYKKFQNEERFIQLMDKYSIDIDEILKEV
jgi:MinD-like ATPase involved in chromosome partitioning or flagellar assembly